MSLSADRNTLTRLNGDISTLRKQEAEQMRKEADATKKVNAAMAKASRTSNASSSSSYVREAERESKKAEEAQGRRAQISGKIADKSRDLDRVQGLINKGEQAEQRKRLTEDTRRQKAYDRRIRDLESQLAERVASTVMPTLTGDEEGVVHDFLSHMHPKTRQALWTAWWQGRGTPDSTFGMTNSPLSGEIASGAKSIRAWEAHILAWSSCQIASSKNLGLNMN